ncbi:hypothetical protein POVWA2_076000 [Plasmodium ovale wallikeri]|uniref:Uncharacterized protein n=1 Tax=Plasmodium ovale wallikeri TaxID=864142 RepID=A0A1A9AJW5_PLAOA|nr:hypothetical protein POVWA1_077080 [Plasmodium ovale wallikeri]SBT56908.1 hypothetical protein POVWA2_076000 [Plasmodium ovale wallikeri]
MGEQKLRNLYFFSSERNISINTENGKRDSVNLTMNGDYNTVTDLLLEESKTKMEYITKGRTEDGRVRQGILRVKNNGIQAAKNEGELKNSEAFAKNGESAGDGKERKYLEGTNTNGEKKKKVRFCLDNIMSTKYNASSKQTRLRGSACQETKKYRSNVIIQRLLLRARIKATGSKKPIRKDSIDSKGNKDEEESIFDAG